MADDGVGSHPTGAGAGAEERERARAERAAARRRLLDVERGSVSNLEAAAACECSCHPCPGQTDKHGVGACPCQWSDDDRRKHLVEFRRILARNDEETDA
jgi:ferredoxin-thioredoxin reductase catalytic subunit